MRKGIDRTISGTCLSQAGRSFRIPFFFFGIHSIKFLQLIFDCHRHRHYISLCFQRTREKRRCGQRYSVGNSRECEPLKKDDRSFIFTC